MALSGLQIQKLLPKTNCKECGSDTCLAFAMKLASKKASLAECPYASDEAKEILGADSEPPVKTIEVGDFKIGGETVLYRHDKTFINQTIIAVNVNDNDPDAEKTIQAVKDYELIRVGELLLIEAIAVTQKSDDDNAFAALVKKAAEVTGKAVIINAANPNAAEAAAAAVKDTKSILAGVNAANAPQMLGLAEANGLTMAVSGDSLDDVINLAKKFKADGFGNLLLDLGGKTAAQRLQFNTIIRRTALKDGNKDVGYPTLTFIDSGDILQDTMLANLEIDKYGGVVVLPTFDLAQLVCLMTLRQNIFTDPQKPIQVEPKVYPIGDPDENSPVFVTTNFSLTYFIVSGEIENAGLSAWLLLPECEGMSVLTAWAAGKFGGAQIGKAAQAFDLEGQVKTREIIIPGYVAQISGELEEAMPGWKVLIGPQEAGDIESYVKAVLSK
ncbi:MAG: acetyl-CoA decarbonylase/synthase complex subunit gamma [Actinomycetia bacterium]|nr:acetyl-CoA decarbonylase/synthase complex subunit gamma [Actinomycetes bacterium]